ncbi:MAG: hypothetical protein FWB90_03405 [Fibromonadales bacterium]|nr:hypothetical protein [Fibromonadales bacterium]
MFTKKIALLGAAGLAAFAMSCSDPDDEALGGDFNPAFAVANGTGALSGTIVANEGISILTVTATADSKPVVLAGLLTTDLPATTLSLSGIELAGVCAATGATASKSFAIKVIATFSAGAELVGTGTATIDCGNSSQDKALVKTPITLSEAGTSYADLDLTGAAMAMGQTAAAAVKSSIDMVAYNSQTGASGSETSIYAPIELDFFWSEDYTEKYFGTVAFFPLPPTGVATIQGATMLSQLKEFLEALDPFIDATEPVFEIPIANNTGFLVKTTEGKFVAVVITASGTKTVTLGTTKWPLE